MQEDDIDIEGETQAGAKYALVFAVIAAVVLMVVTMLFMRGDTTTHTNFKQETPRQAYLDILGEPHTGLRLVRLNDYVVNLAPNGNTKSAAVQRDALSLHEQMAWSRLTSVFYDLQISEAEKAYAFAVYKDIWGQWSRQDDIPKLLERTSSLSDTLPGVSAHMQYAPNKRKSKFSNDTEGTVLAGATATITIQPPTPIARPNTRAYKVREPRIKYAKRPRYPRRARRKGIEAVVTLSLDIDERGNVARTRIISIDADRYKDNFVRAARRAAMRSKFHPKTVGGRPIASSGYLRKYTFGTGG